MGQNLDDANMYYKQQWAREMTPFFGPNGTNFDSRFIRKPPRTGPTRWCFREKFKMDPAFAQKVDEE